MSIAAEFPAPRRVDAAGVGFAVYEQGAGPPVILLHGWPELAYSWKNQIPALADAGYRAVAIDLKGFGRSDAPKDKRLYDIRTLTDELAALLDALRIERAVFCGHDWGGAIVWPMAQRHSGRVSGVIGVSTPHRAPPPVPPLRIIEQRFGLKHYFLQFQEEGAAEALFASDLDRFFRLVFRRAPKSAGAAPIDVRAFDIPGRFRDGPPPDPAQLVMSLADLSVYVDAYRRSGFAGGINLYRNIDRNWEIMRDVDPVIRAPALYVGARDDIFLPPSAADGMESIVPDLTKTLIDDCGHWVSWERPEALNRILIDWLEKQVG
jgi:microsomal epoxide hydrolase/non-specific protein-tyrosine kinase